MNTAKRIHCNFCLLLLSSLAAIHSKSSHVHTHISVLTPASNLPVLDTMRPDPEEAAVQELPLSSVSMETSEGLSEEQLQMIMGASLTIGFIFMLLVDQLGGHAHSSGQ